MDYVKISKQLCRGLEPVTETIEGIDCKLYPLYENLGKDSFYKVGLIDEASSIELIGDAEAKFELVIITNSTIKLFEDMRLTSCTIINSNIVSSRYFDLYSKTIYNSNINIK